MHSVYPILRRKTCTTLCLSFVFVFQGAISRQPCERLIVSPRRQIILEGSVHMLDHNKPQEMYVILFDDMLLITRRKKGLHKKVRE